MLDLDEMLYSNEKLGMVEGGRWEQFNRKRVERFAKLINDCELLDRGFIGPRFTWTNLRSTGGSAQERPDRVLTINGWRDAFPEAVVTHLPRTHSDCCPLKLELKPIKGTRLMRPFRCEAMWFDHPSYGDLVTELWEEGNFKLGEAVVCFQ